MEAVRKVYRKLPDAIKMPKELLHQRVEVILLPLGAAHDKRHGAKSSPSPLAHFAGAWAGEPLTRDDQGEFESREELT